MSTASDLRRLWADLGDVVERHDTGRDLREFERYANDPVGFIRDVLGGDPWIRQEHIAESVRDRALTVVRAGNGVGKDWTAARLALWWVYARGGLVLVTGPTERQVREVVMGEVGRAFRAGRGLPGDLYASSLRVPESGHAGIIAFTSTEASRLTGFHAPRVLAVITEAQGVEDFAWEGLLACAVGAEDRVLAVGNPVSPVGRFYDASRSDAWNALRISVLEHPNLTGGVAIPGGPSKAFAERMASEFGRDGGIYQARVRGEFPEDRTEALVRPAWLDEAEELWRGREAAGWAGAPVYALDVARTGPDSSVLAIHQGGAVRKLVAFRAEDAHESTERIEKEAAEVGARGPLIIDATGLGWSVHDVAKGRGWRVVPFIAAKRADDADRFANARAEAAWRLREALEARKLPLPPDPKLREELLAVEWGLDSAGRIQVQAKDELRAKLRRSPDRADAVVLLAWHLRAPQALPFDINPELIAGLTRGMTRIPEWAIDRAPQVDPELEIVNRIIID